FHPGARRSREPAVGFLRAPGRLRVAQRPCARGVRLAASQRDPTECLTAMKRRTRAALLILLALLGAGCSTHPRRLDCERHLTPINAPAPKSSGTTPHP